MNRQIFVIVSCLCAAAFIAKAGPDAPIWPQTFSQDLVIGDSRTKVYTTGKIFYDFKNNRQRIDFTNDMYDGFCVNIGKDPNATCSQINVNNNLYINLPEKQLCCKCCTAAQGCTVQTRDWLKDYKYAGQATLSGQAFYKWTTSGASSYYATQDAQRVPRRLQQNTFGWDFIMNSYSKTPISDSIFQIPSSCNVACPKQTYCGQIRQKTFKYSLSKALFGKQSNSEQKIYVQQQ